MRPIKFRAWDSKESRWMVDGRTEMGIYDFAFRPDMNWTFITKAEALERVVFMQFTGLLDKNGKEIWEGDICRIRTVEDDGSWKEEWENTEIWFCDGKFLTRYYGFPVSSYSGRGQAQIEVVGNIYETPYLLGPTNEVSNPEVAK